MKTTNQEGSVEYGRSDEFNVVLHLTWNIRNNKQGFNSTHKADDQQNECNKA